MKITYLSAYDKKLMNKLVQSIDNEAFDHKLSHSRLLKNGNISLKFRHG